MTGGRLVIVTIDAHCALNHLECSMFDCSMKTSARSLGFVLLALGLAVGSLTGCDSKKGGGGVYPRIFSDLGRAALEIAPSKEGQKDGGRGRCPPHIGTREALRRGCRAVDSGECPGAVPGCFFQPEWLAVR